MSSLRWRLTASFVVLTVLVVTIMDVVVYAGVARERNYRLREETTQQAHSAAMIFASTGALAGGATLNDDTAPAALRDGVAHGRSGTQIVTDGGASTIWAATAVGGYSPGSGSGVYVQASAQPDVTALATLRNSLIVASLAIVLLAASAGVVLSSRLVQRLGHAAEVARRIAGGELEARIDNPGRDEVAQLASVVDEMAASVQRRITRERRFTADAAHELRTPVTGLVAAAYLLPDGAAGVEMVRRESERLRRLVEDLLEIARLESGREVAINRPVDLTAIATDMAARYPGQVRPNGYGSTVTDPRRLDRVVTNLVDNALRHGAPPVWIEVANHTLAVRDSGPGYPADIGELTDRFVTSGDGSGLGLAIAAEQARIMGAQLELGNTDTGAVARLTWPRPNLDGTRPEDARAIAP